MRKIAALFLISISLNVLAAAAKAADTTGVTADTIKIGMFGPVTGPASVFAKSLYGAAAIYKDVNDNGGINGRKLELVIEDDGCDPNKGIAAVKKLISQFEVFLLHGAWCSSVALAIKSEIAKHPTVPYMVLGAASADISQPVTPNLFHPVATTKTVAEEMVEFALTKPGAKKIAIISHSDEWGSVHLKAAVAKLKEHGLEPVATAALERGGTDATAQVLTIKRDAPDAVLAILYPAELAIYLRDAYKYKLQSTTIGTQAVSIEDTDKRVGIPAATRDLYVFYPLSANITARELAKYANILKKYYPSESLDTISFISMGGSLAIVEALRRLGKDVSREAFMAELNKLKDFDSGVQSGTLTFTPESHAGITSGKMVGMVKNKVVVLERYPTQAN
jgi:branched-chain amino acid transport system substrate-binding protein